MYEGNTEARSRNHSCLRKSISVTDSLCLAVPLVIQHKKPMRRIALWSVTCPAVPHFFTSDKRHDFRWGRELPNVKCVF